MQSKCSLNAVQCSQMQAKANIKSKLSQKSCQNSAKLSQSSAKIPPKFSQNLVKIQSKFCQNSSWSAYRLKSFQSCSLHSFVPNETNSNEF